MIAGVISITCDEHQVIYNAFLFGPFQIHLVMHLPTSIFILLSLSHVYANPAYTHNALGTSSSSQTPETLLDGTVFSRDRDTARLQATQQFSSLQQAPASATANGKRGLAYNWQSPKLDSWISYSKITWAHNWDASNFNLPARFSFVPTLHSAASQYTSVWGAAVARALAASNGRLLYLMSFNEPDIREQANLSPSAAAQAWKKWMQPFAGRNVRLASPSISNGVGINPATNQPMGLDWLRPFLKQCSTCYISFVPVHWYGCTDNCAVAQDVQLFKTQIQQAMAAAVISGRKVPIWITEFQRLGNDQAGFLKQVLPWLDAQPQIARYSYFMVTDGILMQNSQISDLGLVYASA